MPTRHMLADKHAGRALYPQRHIIVVARTSHDTSCRRLGMHACARVAWERAHDRQVQRSTHMVERLSRK